MLPFCRTNGQLKLTKIDATKKTKIKLLIKITKHKNEKKNQKY